MPRLPHVSCVGSPDGAAALPTRLGTAPRSRSGVGHLSRGARRFTRPAHLHGPIPPTGATPLNERDSVPPPRAQKKPAPAVPLSGPPGPPLSLLTYHF